MTITHFFSLLILLIGLDQLSKQWILNTLTEFSSISILPFFNLILVYNRGIAFGIAQQWGHYFLYINTILILMFLVYYLMQISKNQLSLAAHFGFLLIFAGAISNMIDRFFRSAVVDFLDFFIGTHHWPAFNFADSWICIGCALLIFFFQPSRKNSA